MIRELALAAVAALALGSAAQAAPVYADNFNANLVGLNAVPTGWTVTGGTVDLIGSGANGTLADLLPGNGVYVDLDGSTNQAGLLTSPLLSLLGGVTYTATFDLAGSQRGSNETGTVTFGSTSLGFNIVSSVGFVGFSLSFTPSVGGNYTLSFQNDGGDNVGALLDNVVVTEVAAAVPEPETYALLGAGLLAMGVVMRRRKTAA